MKKSVTVIPGDGIGPEVVRASMRVGAAAGASIAWEEHNAGMQVFKSGDPTGVPADTVASIQRTHVALKGPLETPVGYGEKSANVTLRKYLETFGNVRPIRELPNIKTPFYGRNIDLTIVRENVEDLYTGIEHMQTPNASTLGRRKVDQRIHGCGYRKSRAPAVELEGREAHRHQGAGPEGSAGLCEGVVAVGRWRRCFRGVGFSGY